jgi:dihydropteroate synthase
VRYDSVSRRPGPEPTPRPAPRAEPVIEALAPLELASPAVLALRGRRFDAGNPAVMAIVNRTRDSFFSGNRHDDLEAAKAALSDAVQSGADIVDIGGVRAGQEGEAVDAGEEIRRVVPLLQWARATCPEVILSLDTWRSEVAREAAGVVDLVNDTWAGHDPELVHVAAEVGAGYVVSHTGGLAPRTDPVDVSYGADPLDVVRDVLATLSRGALVAEQAGIPPERVLIDPTLDFGKTTIHSLEVLRHTADVVALNYPVLQAISRKDFIGETLALSAEERLEGSLAATSVAAWLGATVFRSHDVRATRRVLDMVATIRGDRAPKLALRGTGRRPEPDGPANVV